MQYFELLSRDQIAAVHQATLELLETVGIDFHFQPARDILLKGGAKVDGSRVYMPRNMVESQIAKAPASFRLYARNPKHDLIFGADRSLFAPVCCPPFVSDWEKGRREGTLADFEALVKLTHTSQNLDMCSNILVEPGDIPIEQRPARTVYTCLRYSDKCFMGSVIGEAGARQTLQMLSIVFGEMQSMIDRPRVIAIPCSLTPLGYDARMLGAMMVYAEAAQPQLINSLVIAGATAPVTLAGSLALQNAEILAGIVLVQLVREGAPVVYASGSSSSDLRFGSLAVGAPEMAINNTLAAQMARFYNIPSRGVGTLTDAKTPDAQAGYESMMNLMAAQNSGIHFVLHAAGSLETINCVSYEKFMIDDEMIGMVRRIQRGIEVNADSLALDTIKAVGPGGQFLDQDHTLRHCRSEFYLPSLSNRDTFTKWEKKGGISAMEAANKKWKAVIESYDQPYFPADVDRDLMRFMRLTEKG